MNVDPENWPAQFVGVAVTVHLGHQPGGKGVDDRCPDPVQSAGSPVGTATELAARMELGEDDLQGGDLSLGVPIDRDAAAIVGHLDGAVAVQRDLDAVSEAGCRFVDCVVHEFPDEVHESLRARASDVHAGSLPHRLQALKRLDGIGVVTVAGPLGRRSGLRATG